MSDDAPMKNGRIPKNAILMGGDPADYPPWTDRQQDAQIEAVRYAFCELARALHEQGVLDMNAVSARLGNAEWLYADKSPDTLDAVRWIAGNLDYMRLKLGPPPHRRGKASSE